MMSITKPQRGRIMKRVIWGVAFIAALLGGRVTEGWAQGLTIEFTVSTEEGKSQTHTVTSDGLRGCLINLHLNTNEQIQKMKVIEGEFADWETVINNIKLAKSLTYLQEVEFAEGVKVDDIPDTNGDQHSLLFTPSAIKQVHFRGSTPARIGKFAFSNCYNLERVTLPTGLKEIGVRAFHECSRMELASGRLPEGLTTLGEGAFYHCNHLKEIVVPDGVTVIGEQTFAECSNLEKITLPEGITTIGYGAFFKCDLHEMVIPKGVTQLPSQTFGECRKLEKVILPEGLTTLGDRAFHHCAFKEITLPASVTTFGTEVFTECEALQEVTCMNPEPAKLHSSVFSYVPVKSCMLYVPKGSEKKYKEAEVWKEFKMVESFKITFHFEEADGEPAPVTRLSKGQKMGEEPKNITRYGYVFKGWSTTKGSTTPDFDENTEITEDTEVYAVWVESGYTVTFLDNDGSKELHKEFVEKNTSIRKMPEIAPDEGEILKGWTKTKGGNTPDFDEKTEITEDITLYAVWAPSCTITFFTEDKMYTVIVEKGAPMGTISIEEPKKKGHSFKGWATEKDHKTPNFDENTVVKENTWVYPVWGVKICVITFDSKGGTKIAPKKVEYNQYLEPMPAPPTREGYTFIKWATHKDAKEGDYQYYFDEYSCIEDDMTVYAIWNPIVLTVTFDTKGGSTIDPREVNWGETLDKIDIPTYAGHLFVGWTTTKSHNTPDFDENTVVKNNITVYALWAASFTVTFLNDENTQIAQVQVKQNTAIDTKMPELPTRDKYLCKGWTKTKGGNTPDFDANTLVEKDMTVYAVWASCVNVIFLADENTNIATVPVEQNTAMGSISVDVPKRKGYTFKGWSKTKDGDTPDFDENTLVEEDMTVYAVWEPVVLTVTFDTKGGSTIDPQAVNWGEALKTLDTPTRKGYTFKGWSKTQDGDTPDFDENTLVEEDMTVYAVWEKDQSTPPKGKDSKAGSEKKEKVTAVESSLLAHATVGPNPLGEYLVVRGVEKAKEYRITNLMGHTLLHGTLQGNTDIRINTESLPAGVYLLTLQATDGVTTFRIMKL